MASASAKKVTNRRVRLMNLKHRSLLLQAFGRRLEQLRLRQGLSPSVFEARSGIDAGNLAKYERGDREPGLVLIVIMAKALEVHPYELLDFDFDFDQIQFSSPKGSTKAVKYGVIKSNKQRVEYAEMLNQLVSADPESKTAKDEIELLEVLIRKWDKEHDHSKYSSFNDPIAVLRSLMQERNMKSRDLVKVLGVTKGFVSNVLHYRKGLSKENIKVLAEYFGIDMSLLVGDRP